MKDLTPKSSIYSPLCEQAPNGVENKNSPVPGCRAAMFGAENGIRTRDLNLGKVALYQLSYFRNISRFPSKRDCKYKSKFLKSKNFLNKIARHRSAGQDVFGKVN